MNQSNVSHASSGPERSPFQSVESALNRKPLPGPTWAWAGLAAAAVCGLVFLVTRGPAEHRPHAEKLASTESAEPAAPNAAPVAAAEPAPSPTPPVSDAPAPAPAPSAAPADVPASDAPAVASDATPAKAGDDVVASAPVATKKKGRGAHGGRKHSARAH